MQKIFWELIEPGVLDLRNIGFEGFERGCRACLTGELIPLFDSSGKEGKASVIPVCSDLKILM